jgi:hypothetical protein
MARLCFISYVRTPTSPTPALESCILHLPSCAARLSLSVYLRSFEQFTKTGKDFSTAVLFMIKAKRHLSTAPNHGTLARHCEKTGWEIFEGLIMFGYNSRRTGADKLWHASSSQKRKGRVFSTKPLAPIKRPICFRKTRKYQRKLYGKRLLGDTTKMLFNLEIGLPQRITPPFLLTEYFLLSSRSYSPKRRFSGRGSRTDYLQQSPDNQCVKDIKMSELILNYIRDPMALYIQAVGYCSREVFVYANDECGCIA